MAQFKNIVDFSLTSHVALTNCNSWVILNEGTDGKGSLQAMHFHCSIKKFPKYAYAHIIKTPDLE